MARKDRLAGASSASEAEWIRFVRAGFGASTSLAVSADAGETIVTFFFGAAFLAGVSGSGSTVAALLLRVAFTGTSGCDSSLTASTFACLPPAVWLLSTPAQQQLLPVLLELCDESSSLAQVTQLDQ